MENKQEWLKKRKNYIGGSDIAAIVGLNKYKTAVDVFLDKTSEVIEETANEAAKWGTLLEDLLIQEYAQYRTVEVEKPIHTIFHPEYEFLGANIDAYVNRGEYVLECKTAGYRMADQWGEEGTDQIPDNYLCQVAWYSAITRVPKVDIAVLIGGQDFRVYTYTKNKEFEDKLIAIGINFWINNVQKNIPPIATNTHDVFSLYPRGNGKELKATEEIIDKLNRFKMMNEEKSALEKTLEVLKKNIQEYMQDYDILVDENGNVLSTWKNTSPRAGIDLKRFKDECKDLYLQYANYSKSSRVFLVK